MICSGCLGRQKQQLRLNDLPMEGLNTLETYFTRFRDQIIGSEQAFDSPYGRKKILYADWTASGRAYQPIEDYLQQQILPFAANTHTGSNFTGSLISQA